MPLFPPRLAFLKHNISSSDIKNNGHVIEGKRMKSGDRIPLSNQIKQKAASMKSCNPPFLLWCLGPESNRHGTKYRGILSPLRLPFPPPRRWTDFPRIQGRSQEGKCQSRYTVQGARHTVSQIKNGKRLNRVPCTIHLKPQRK